MFLRVRLHIETDAGARAGAGADAELRFGRIDAIAALHPAGLLREPIDPPDAAVRDDILVSKKELERKYQGDDGAGGIESGAAPLRNGLEPLSSTIGVESRYGVQNESLLQTIDHSPGFSEPAGLIRPNG